MSDARAAAAADPTAAREARYRRDLSLDSLFPFEPFEPHWIGDDSVWYAGADGDAAVTFDDFSSGTSIGPISLARIAVALGRQSSSANLPFDRMERIAGGLRFARGSASVDYDALVDSFSTVEPNGGVRPGHWTRTLTLTTGVPADDAVTPDGSRFATIENGNLVLVSCIDAARTAFTADAEFDVRWELESGRIAFAGVKPWKASPWSPDGASLFAARVDRRTVRTIPTFDFLGDTITIGRMQAEAPGTPMPQVDGFLFDAATGAQTAIGWGDTTEVLLVFVGWMRDGADCWFVRFSRDLGRAEVLAVDRSGATRVVFVEEGRTFLRIQHNLLYPGDAGMVLLPDCSGFLWLSERSGWRHIDRVSRDGSGRYALTAGEWPVIAIEGVDERGRIFFTAQTDPMRPYDVQLWRVPHAGGDLTCLTPGSGHRVVSMSPSLAHFIEIRSTLSEAPVATARDADGRIVRVLHRTDMTPLLALGWRAPDEVVVKARDSVTDLWGVLYLPADFDESLRYPVIEHIYAGPQVAYAPHRFHCGERYKPWNLPQALAQLGFAVVVLDTPGTPGRSKAFHDAVFQAMGRPIVEEHAAALRRLAETRPYLDLSRAGIYGHSWGALFAVRALAESEGLYGCAVASGPALEPDNLMSEPYLGSDPTHAAYAAYSPRTLAQRIPVDALMMVTGTSEVPMFHASLRMSQALIDAGVRHELIVLPGQSHGYAGTAADYYMTATTRFFQQRLGGPVDDRHH